MSSNHRRSKLRDSTVFVVVYCNCLILILQTNRNRATAPLRKPDMPSAGLRFSPICDTSQEHNDEDVATETDRQPQG